MPEVLNASVKLQNTSILKGIALISPPWPLYNRPSIQIGSLKAFLKSRFPKLEIQGHPIYLQVAEGLGYSVYQAISERSRLAETIYAALLFPEKRKEAMGVFRRLSFGSK